MPIPRITSTTLRLFAVRIVRVITLESINGKVTIAGLRETTRLPLATRKIVFVARTEWESTTNGYVLVNQIERRASIKHNLQDCTIRQGNHRIQYRVRRI